MSKECQVTGKTPMAGTTFLRQLIKLKESSCLICIVTSFGVESENKYVTLTLSAKGMRIIDKKGIDVVLKEIRGRGEKI